MGAAMIAHRAAFVGVDGTLTAGTALRGLVEHLGPRRPAEPTVGDLAAVPARPGQPEAAGASPDELGLACYRLLGGQPVGAVAAAGRAGSTGHTGGRGSSTT